MLLLLTDKLLGYLTTIQAPRSVSNNRKSVNAKQEIMGVRAQSISRCYLSMLWRPKGHMENFRQERQSWSWASHSRPPDYKGGGTNQSAITFGVWLKKLRKISTNQRLLYWCDIILSAGKHNFPQQIKKHDKVSDITVSTFHGWMGSALKVWDTCIWQFRLSQCNCGIMSTAQDRNKDIFQCQRKKK